MHSLSESDRDILRLKYAENWSYRQLAGKMGLSERAVEYRLICAKQNLRKELQRLNFGECHEKQLNEERAQ